MTFLDAPPPTADSSALDSRGGGPLHGSDANLAIGRRSYLPHKDMVSWGGQMWFLLGTKYTGVGDVNSDPDFANIVDLLSDPHVRTILLVTSVEPCSATDLAERCDASDQTVYRRLERLEEAGLVSDRIRARDDGHHDTVYTARLEHVSITLREGEFEFTIEHIHPDAADELTDLWRRF